MLLCAIHDQESHFDGKYCFKSRSSDCMRYNQVSISVNGILQCFQDNLQQFDYGFLLVPVDFASETSLHSHTLTNNLTV